MNNICVYSSFFILISAILALYKKYYIYAFLLFILVITSFCFHYYTNKFTFIIDQIAVVVIIVYSFYLFCYKIYVKRQLKLFNNKTVILMCLIIISFLIVCHLFVYGYYTKQYCFNKDKNIGESNHSLLHVVSCYGFNNLVIM